MEGLHGPGAHGVIFQGSVRGLWGRSGVLSSHRLPRLPFRALDGPKESPLICPGPQPQGMHFSSPWSTRLTYECRVNAVLLGGGVLIFTDEDTEARGRGGLKHPAQLIRGRNVYRQQRVIPAVTGLKELVYEAACWSYLVRAIYKL